MNPQLSLLKTMALACGAALLMVGVALLLLDAPGAAQAAPTDTIQSMIDLAPDGGTVNIPSGTYTESLTVNKTLTLTGVSSATTVIQAITGQRVITVTSGHNLRLVNLTVTGGHPTSNVGGGIFAANDLQIVNCRLANNSADYGGGVFQEANTGRVDVIGSRIELNTTGNHGGGLYVSGNVALTNTQVLSNAAAGHGGGLHVQAGRADFVGGVLANNSAGMNGGALNTNNSISITGAQFINNTSNDCGGALVQWNAGYTVTLTNTRFERNTAKNSGGGAFIAGASLISNSTFMTNTVNSGNTTNTSGGGVYADGSSQVFASTFVSNTARCPSCSYASGGGLYTSKPTTIQDSTFDRNYAWGGGGVYGYYTAITVTRSTFKNNSAGYGGAIGAITIRATGSDFLSNRAVNQGGALSAQDMTLSGTRFIGNTSGAPGGGLRVLNRLDAVNTLFAGNQAGQGAAVMQLEGTQYTLRHVTIAHPSPGSGPAVLLTSGTANITNTIIASYTVGISQTGGILTADYDLFFTATPTQTSGGTLNWGAHNLNANPRFVNPATSDYHLSPGSPAADAGTNVGVTTDLDGVTRPQGSGYDIGAYESLSSGPCYARLVSNSATYTSTDASAVQSAVDVAPQGDTVKIAGTCAGVQLRGGIVQTVYISKSLTLRGGYTTTNWLTSNPIAYPTALDAQQAGRVVVILNAPGMLVNGELPVASSKPAIAQPARSLKPQVPAAITIVSLENLIVCGGLINNGGGGIYNDGALVTLSNTTVRDNSATNAFGGGGIMNWNSGTLTVTGSLLTGNSASYGGGIFNNNGKLVLINSTLSENQSPTGSPVVDGGGALDQWGASPSATIVNSTIASNTAVVANRSGIWLESGTLNIESSIIARNGVTNNIALSGGTFTSLGYNLTNSGAGTPFTATAELTNTDPLLGSLQDNGGSTWTHALLPDSPAIDRIPIGVHGCGTSMTSDQRGQLRPGTFIRLCDSGAYEVQGVYYRVYLPVVIK
ncbi:putative outer membrane protein PmpB [Thermoflexales bacterium]|nr:putative outer membrane protein PmpB [Thermoflexales bacterium]